MNWIVIGKWYSAIIATLSVLTLMLYPLQDVTETAQEATQSNFLGIVLFLPVVAFLWWVALNKNIK